MLDTPVTHHAAQVIAWFWEVAHGFTDGQKKQLLAFVTGSDRVPLRGLAALEPPFVISRNGGASNRLPTAHTCFNHLLLPAYAVSPATLLALGLNAAQGMLCCSAGCPARVATGTHVPAPILPDILFKL